MPIPGRNGGTGSNYFTVEGPTTDRVYTFPDANSTIVDSTGAGATGTWNINITGTSGNQSLANNKVYYVSPAGNDSNIGYSTSQPFLTLGAALIAAGSSGNQICVFPGTYAGNFTITQQNLTISAANTETGGIVNFTGTITVNNTASSVRINGLTMDRITHANSGSLYLTNCKINTAFLSSGSGYFEATNTETTGTSGAGTVSITGSGSKVFIGGNKIGITTINNASAVVNISNALTVNPITLTNGTLFVGDSVVYSATATSNAVAATAGTFIANNITCVTPTGTNARINIGASVVYNIRSGFFDKVNSVLAGINSPTPMIADNINSATYASDSFTAFKILSTDANKKIVTNSVITYVPTIGDGTNNFVTSTATGYYLDLGAMIFVNATIIWTSKGSAVSGSQLRVSLPASINASTNASVPVLIGNATGINFVNVTLQALGSPGNNYFILQSLSTIGSATTINVSGANATGNLQFSCFYFK